MEKAIIPMSEYKKLKKLSENYDIEVRDIEMKLSDEYSEKEKELDKIIDSIREWWTLYSIPRNFSVHFGSYTQDKDIVTTDKAVELVIKESNKKNERNKRLKNDTVSFYRSMIITSLIFWFIWGGLITKWFY